jgi:hypothetical protein
MIGRCALKTRSGEDRAFLDADGLVDFVRRFGALQEEMDPPAKKDG